VTPALAAGVRVPSARPRCAGLGAAVACLQGSVARLVRWLFLGLACAGVLAASGCGAADPQLEPRFVAVHNALVASGLVQSGTIHRGTLAQGEEHRVVVRLEAGRCHTFVVLAAAGVKDVDLLVRDEAGETLGRDGTDDRHAAVRACAVRSEDYQVVVRAVRGGGPFLLSSWSPAGQDDAAGEHTTRPGRGDGTCEAPLALRAGRAVRGDTRQGRSLMHGSCAEGSAPEQVFRVQVPERSLLSVRVQAGFDSVVYVRGDCMAAESEAACNDDAEQGQPGRSEVDVTVDPGAWFVVVDGYGSEAGDFQLEVTLTPLPPLAQVCAEAPALTAGQSATGTTRGAADHLGASCGGGARSPDRIYHLDVPHRSRLRVRQQSDHDGVLHLRSRCADADSEVACNDDWLDPNRSSLRAVVDPGRYYLVTDGFSERGQTSAGDFRLLAEVEPLPAPSEAGAACAAAERLAFGQEVELDTFAARDGLAGSCGGSGAPEAVYRVDVPKRSRLRATVRASEPQAVLYLRSRCDQPSTEMACVPVPRAEPRDRLARLDAVVERGVHYLVFDGEGQEEFGAARLLVELHDVANLERACRTAPLLQPGRTATGDTRGRSDDFQASCGERAESSDMVYRLRVTGRARVVLELASEFDGVLHLRRECAHDASEVACNDDHGDNRHSRIEVTLDPGLYYVVVDGFRSGNSGRFSLATFMDPL
jgi:hypothetical protein